MVNEAEATHASEEAENRPEIINPDSSPEVEASSDASAAPEAEASAPETVSQEEAPPAPEATAAPAATEAEPAEQATAEAGPEADEPPAEAPSAPIAAAAKAGAASEPSEASAPADQAPVAEAQAAEAQVTEAEPAEAQVAETQVTEAQAAEPPAAEAQAAEPQAAEAQPEPEPAEPAEPTAHDLTVERLRQAKESGETVEGRVIGWNQGGFHVIIDEVTAFCPRSEIEIRAPRSPQHYLDQTYHFQVIKHQRRGRRIVLSRKGLLEAQRSVLAAETLKKLAQGADLSGRISSITDFGAFVDLGGIEGLVHLSELAQRRVKHPREVVKVGQEVTVRVLKVEQDGQRISLSMKALEPDPWLDFASGHPRGTEFAGTIVRHTDFGLFIELPVGLDGMVHLSQLPPGKKLDDETLATGTQVQGWVLKVEPERQRISLSLREVPADDPWQGVRDRFPEGSMVEGEVEDLSEFGAFILLEPGLTGLLPRSEMAVPRGQDAGKLYIPGKKVRVQVATVDPSRRRISLAAEGSALEGTRADYKAYVKKDRGPTSKGGFTPLAAAFEKLKAGER